MRPASRPDRALRRAVAVTAAAIVVVAGVLVWAVLGDDGATLETRSPPPPESEVSEPFSGVGPGQPFRQPSSGVVVIERPGSRAEAARETEGQSSGGPTSAPSTTTTTAPPARPVRQPAVDGDVDGDGRPDRVTLVPGVESVRVVAWLTTLGAQEATVAASAAKLIGIVDVNANGFAEIVLRTDHRSTEGDEEEGAEGGVIGSAITLADDRLTEVVTASGEPWRFEVGSTHGLECRDAHESPGAEIITTETEGTAPRGRVAQPAEPATIVQQIHRLVGAELEQLGDPETVEEIPEVACGSLPPAEEWSAD